MRWTCPACWRESDWRLIFGAGCSKALPGGSRTIVTTRYQPSDVPVLPSRVHREDLADFPESSFLKIMQRDPVVERRSRSGELFPCPS